MKIIIYGTGVWGKCAYKRMSGHHEILFFVDKDVQKQGEFLFDKQVMAPDIIKKHLDICIVIAVKNNADIVKYLRDIGVKSFIEFSPYDYSYDTEELKAYHDSPIIYWSDSHNVLDFDRPYSCTSQLCNQSFWDMPFFQFWSSKLMPNLIDHLKATEQFTLHSYTEPVLYHRKLWEWVYICQALYERGCLSFGKRGVGFGIGQECIPDLFASFGCNILATDLMPTNCQAAGWIASGQHAAGHIDLLNQYGFCTEETFRQRVSYRDIDMNSIDDDLVGFDFCWSSCALEHLGGLKPGLDFIKNSLKTLKTGGVAVHTTEFNLSSNEDTFEMETLSLYRKRDIIQLVSELEHEGHYVFPVDWYVGGGPLDSFIDFPPHSKKDMHLRLMVERYICTSIGLIIVKGGERMPSHVCETRSR